MKSTLRTMNMSGAAVLMLISLAAPSFAQSQAPSDAPDPAESEAQVPTADEAEAGDESPADAPAHDEVDPYAEAKERVGRAEQLYEDGNYDAALTEFEQAYAAMLGHPARNYVLFNVGKCQEKLYRYDAAIRSYRTYLENSGDGAEDKGTVEAKIELLEGLLGTLTVQVSATEGPAPAKYEVWVDGRLIDPEAHERFMIPGGNHQVEVRAEGFELQNREVQIPARSEKTLEFSLVPLAAEYRGLPSVYFWSASGLAVASGIAGGAFGAMALSKRSAVDQKLPEQRSEEDRDAIVKRAMYADIFFVGAGVFTTTAVILAFMTDWSGRSTEKGPITVKEVGFTPTPHGGYMGIRGAF